MGQTPDFRDTLRKLAMVDEGFVEDQARLGLDPASTSAWEVWEGRRRPGCGCVKDEVADVLLVIAPLAGLGRVVCAAPDLAIALGYDIEAALEDPGPSQ